MHLSYDKDNDSTQKMILLISQLQTQSKFPLVIARCSKLLNTARSSPYKSYPTVVVFEKNALRLLAEAASANMNENESRQMEILNEVASLIEMRNNVLKEI